ncbi:hypothetical protein [Aggregatilinea lenta]|uniref:hypothetical protein n=1 Tax=Aggregatilinea lenta TaxID=913108 RepID=UPI000E5BF327|nr:hypothetical protein [Aggregatilinea lenta]
MAEYPDLPPDLPIGPEPPAEAASVVPPTDDVPAPEPSPTRQVRIEDLTLVEALRYLWWRPAITGRLLWRVLTRVPGQTSTAPELALGAPDAVPSRVRYLSDEDEVAIERAAEAEPGDIARPPTPASEMSPWAARVVVLVAAILLAVWGGALLNAARLESDPTRADMIGAALARFVLAGAMVTGFEIFARRGGWARRFPRAVALLRHPLPPTEALALNTVLLGGTGLLFVASLLLHSVIVPVLFFGLWVIALLRLSPAEVAFADPIAIEAPPDEAAPPVEADAAASVVTSEDRGFWPWFYAHIYQLLLMPVALLFSAFTFVFNVQRDPGGKILDVVLTPIGFTAWVISIALWIVALSVDLRAWIAHRPPLHLPDLPRMRRPYWPVLAILLITLAGAAIRLHSLDSTPPEMTSDHIEKLLDSLRVGEGHYGVFFPNNGGREGFQMYLVAFIAELGAGYSFTALKLATVLEGTVTLPLLWWMARQVFGDDTEARRDLGNWVGLAMAALVAVSSWHIMLSRLGLRIVLTPLTAALVIGFLARAMRHNRLSDWLKLGFTLGAGIYFYQANRMLPVAVGIGVALAVLAQARSWDGLGRTLLHGLGLAGAVGVPLLAYAGVTAALSGASGEAAQDAGERLGTFLPLFAMLWCGVIALALRSRWWARSAVFSYGGGALAMVVIALAVFVPMYRYSELFPDYFWNRTWGRMFGENAFMHYEPEAGGMVPYDPSLMEQVERFMDQRDVFADNFRDALRMYHWQGDEMWITNADLTPAMDALTGGLLALGGLLWIGRMLRRRDPVDWLLPAAGLVMLLPSAMTLAYTNENPSFTRASGTIPVVYLFAALPVGLLCASVVRALSGDRRMAVTRVVLGLAVVAGVAGAALPPNWTNFFDDYRLSYAYSWRPYHAIAAPMREFARGEGSYGNAFMVAYPYWLDHRILGTVAGDIRWPNGLVEREDLLVRIRLNQGTAYQFDPGRPIFVMFNSNDPETADYLQQLIPGGTIETYTYSYETSDGLVTADFQIFHAPGANLDLDG